VITKLSATMSEAEKSHYKIVKLDFTSEFDLHQILEADAATGYVRWRGADGRVYDHTFGPNTICIVRS
jgi:hypothetical protein